MKILSINSFRLKIDYDNIVNNNILIKHLKMTAIMKAKSEGHIYYDELDSETQYNIAVDVFRILNIIYRDNNKVFVLDFNKLNIDTNTQLIPVDEISQSDMIDYFNKYYIKHSTDIDNIFVTIYHNEYTVPVAISSLFMDVKDTDFLALETSIDNFIITTYRRFISTPQGQIPFIPWFGTRIKEYLHDLSIYQAEEMLQAEIDGLTNALKLYLAETNTANYDIAAEVRTIENIQYGQVQYKIIITINSSQYTITIK